MATAKKGKPSKSIYKVMNINIYVDKKGRYSAETEVHEVVSQDTVVKVLETLIAEINGGKIR